MSDSRSVLRRAALKYFVNGRRARDLHGLTDLAGDVLTAFDTATGRAFADLRRRAAPAASRAARQRYNVKARALSGKFRIVTGSRGHYTGERTRDDFLGIWASTARISLIEFQGRWRGRRSAGATATIEAGAGAKTYAGAFIATVQGRRAIRVRSIDRGTGRRAARGPLRMLRGPSPWEMLAGVDGASRAVRDQVLKELHTAYTTELGRQWRLKRSK